MPKRSPEDVLRDIDQSEFDDVVDRVLAMTPEERRRDLQAQGVDVKELDAKADALYARFQHAAPPDAGGGKVPEASAPPLPGDAPANAKWETAAGGAEPATRGASANVVALPRRPRRTVWTVSLLAVALGLLMYVLGTGGGGVTAPNPGEAGELRDEAIAACDARRWDECKQKLDRARALDPKGEEEPHVVAARKALRQAGKP